MDNMTMNDYQQAARRTALYPRHLAVIYPTIGLAGETGEVAEKVKKTLRDNNGTFDDERRDAIMRELGDVLWYVANIAADLGLSLDDIASTNLDKLASRAARNRLHGDGDNR